MSGKRVQINKRISRLIQEQLNKMFAKKMNMSPVVETAPAKQADVTLNKDVENDDSAEVVEIKQVLGKKPHQW